MNFLVDAFVDNNLGDDLMLEMLVRRFPGSLFFCLRDAALNGQPPYRDWPNLLVPHWTDLERILPFMDGLLVYGGSLWQDYGDNQAWFDWRERALMKLQARGCPALAIGNSMGPVHTEEGRERFGNLLRRFTHVVVRDETSHAWMEAQVGPGRAVLGADLVFDYEVPEVAKEPGLVGISVHRSILRPERNAPYVENLTALIQALHRSDPGLRFRLLAFDSITENDEILMDQILANLGGPAWITKAVYLGDIPAFLQAFGACDRIFASRFHALILALLNGVPFVPFDYMDKTRNLLKDLRYEGVLATHETFAGSMGAIHDQLLGATGTFSRQALDTMRARASLNFEAIGQACGTASPTPTKQIILDLLGQLREPS